MKKIEEIRVLVSEQEVIADDGRVVKVTISNGISQLKDGLSTLDELLKEADIALYEAKDRGRNKVIFR